MVIFKTLIKNYLLRHRNKINILLHIFGIPLVLFGVFQLFTARWKRGLFNIFMGYLLQWGGHGCFEKKESWELTLIKRLVKKLAGGR